MEINIPYGHSFLPAIFPDQIQIDIIEPSFSPSAQNPNKVVLTALTSILGDFEFSSFLGAKSVAIAVNDKTRPVPNKILLPPLLEQLERLAIPDEAITFYVAVGSHPPMVPSDFSSILPPNILERYSVISHDSEAEDTLIFLGETDLATPVHVNHSYYQADLKIAVGNIEAHQFAGYSGGVKTAAIGLSGLKTITQNHALMTHPNSQIGKYKNNPTRDDIEEIGRMVGVDLALNAILNQQKELVHVLAGDPVAVMEAGVQIAEKVGHVAVAELYELVISSPGGHPKDINVYQSQKALSTAVKITRPGGTVIIAAACPEGAGSPHYQEWIKGKNSNNEVIQQFLAEGFRIGPHKAYQIARDSSHIRLMFCSEMEDDLANLLLLNPVKDFQNAVDQALGDLKPGERIAVLPRAASTVPYLNN